ncbi:MAG: hypothetical protein CMJ73_00980 [Planctomycetaceae bacterium]|nr:hypothetical protein [Planctomycetaceae bacterium]
MANEHNWYYEKQGELIGPIDAATMRDMINSGGLTGATPVWRDGLIGRQPIAHVPELAGYLPDPSAPASQAAVQPVAVTQVHSGAPTSGLAVASLVLGIISLALFCLIPISLPCGIIGLILGLSGAKGPSKQPLATAGIVTSIIGILISVLLVVGAMQDGNQPGQNRFDEIFNERNEAEKDEDFEEALEELKKGLEKAFGEAEAEGEDPGEGEGEGGGDGRDPDNPFDVEPE